MYALVEALINTLYGAPVNPDVIEILALTLTLNVLGLMLSFMRLQGKTWTFTCKVIIVLLALTLLGGATWSFSLS